VKTGDVHLEEERITYILNREPVLIVCIGPLVYLENGTAWKSELGKGWGTLL